MFQNENPAQINIKKNHALHALHDKICILFIPCVYLILVNQLIIGTHANLVIDFCDMVKMNGT